MDSPQILPAQAFDFGTVTAQADVRQHMAVLQDEAKAGGIDFEALCRQTDHVSAQDAPGLFLAIHEAASLLFLQWQRARRERQIELSLAIARLFNGLLYDCRQMIERYDLVDHAHLQRLQAALSTEVDFEAFEPEVVAHFVDAAARAHTHEQAWPWVVLPTFARQPYGRILLFALDIPDTNHHLFVTQPFFLEGQSPLFHTHGQNWAYSCPLGRRAGDNAHINSLWRPSRPDEPFPLERLDLADYCAGDVAVIPPKMIHGISRKRCTDERPIPPLTALLSDESLKADWLARTRFGELACLHIYCPHLPLAQQLAASPFVQEDERFFIENDMIVFDHVSEQIWSGGGGSWPRRMIAYGAIGEHCGTCYEDDPRRENLDPRLVSQWFVQSPPAPLVKFTFTSQPL